MSRLRNIPGAEEVIARSGFVVQNPEEKRGRWQEVFPSSQPLYIEIGMGKGRFLMDMAGKYPDRNYIGIEMYHSVLFRALQKAEIRAQIEAGTATAETARSKPVSVREGREKPWPSCNFRFIRMDARHLTDVFAPGEIDGIYLNFSDPWPKERHGNRRLTSENFLKLYEQVLKPGGKVEFKTDNRPLFDFSLEEIRNAGWNLEAYTFDLHHDETMNRGNIMTEYEEKFSAKGNAICKLIASPGK